MLQITFPARVEKHCQIITSGAFIIKFWYVKKTSSTDSRHLILFHEIIRVGSFTQAAEILSPNAARSDPQYKIDGRSAQLQGVSALALKHRDDNDQLKDS